MVFYSDLEHFAIEELHLHGPNVLSFQLVGEVPRLMVEYHDASAMSAWIRHLRHLKSTGLPCVKYVGKFGYLQHDTINPSLHRGVPGRDRGTGGGQRKWCGSACIIS